jgi:hypothetical protein
MRVFSREKSYLEVDQIFTVVSAEVVAKCLDTKRQGS